MNSQAEIELLKRAGWKEDQKSRSRWRWRHPKYKTLHTLQDAIECVSQSAKKKSGAPMVIQGPRTPHRAS